MSLAKLGFLALALAICARTDLPFALLLVLGPLSLGAAGYAGAAAAQTAKRSGLLRQGRCALALLGVLTLAAFFSSAGDWVHLLWNVQYPLHGLLLGSGLLLVRVWPDDRREEPESMRGAGAGIAALLACLALGSAPMWLTLLPVNPRPAGAVSGAVFPALLEVARYGFDGTLPSVMRPETAAQIERGFGAFPRFVTLPMAASLLAAGAWILFAGLALLGRALPAGEARHGFFLLAPLVVAPASLLFTSSRTWSEGIWKNEPWLVRAYGPTLLVAAAATFLLLVALRRDERFARGVRSRGSCAARAT